MDTDSEEEIFFGPVTDREKQVALKYYEKFPGELRISSCLTYGILGNIADVTSDKIENKSSERNSHVNVSVISPCNHESKFETTLETDTRRNSDVTSDNIEDDSSGRKFQVVCNHESKIEITLETNTRRNSAVLPERVVDESSAGNSTFSEDLVFINDENKHGIILEANIGNLSDVLPDRILDESSVGNSSVSEDLVFISDENKHDIILEANVGNLSDVLPDRILDESSVGNSSVSEDLVFISDENKHDIILETNVGNLSDVLLDRILDESSVGSSTVSEDLIFISDENKHGIILETNVGNPSAVLPDRTKDELSERNSLVCETLEFLLNDKKKCVMLEKHVRKLSDVSLGKLEEDVYDRNTLVSEPLLSSFSNKNKSDIALEAQPNELSDVLSHIVELESFERTSPVPEALASPHSDKSEECLKLDGEAENQPDVSLGKLEEDVYDRNTPVSEPLLSSFSNKNKSDIALEAQPNELSDVLSHIVELESFERTSPVPEALASPHSDKSEECLKLDGEAENQPDSLPDKLEGETSDGNSLTTEEMLASPLHHECFCITLETNTNELSDFEWLQENSHASEALVSPLNNGSKLGIVLERKFSVTFSENNKDESSEGNCVFQASAPPQNYRSEHNNTVENADIQSDSMHDIHKGESSKEHSCVIDMLQSPPEKVSGNLSDSLHGTIEDKVPEIDFPVTESLVSSLNNENTSDITLVTNTEVVSDSLHGTIEDKVPEIDLPVTGSLVSSLNNENTSDITLVTNTEVVSASQVIEKRTEIDVVENLSIEFAYRLGEAFPPPGDYVTLDGNVPDYEFEKLDSSFSIFSKIEDTSGGDMSGSFAGDGGIYDISKLIDSDFGLPWENSHRTSESKPSGSTENGEDKIIDEDSPTVVDSRLSEDGIQIVEDCEKMEKVVPSGKYWPDKTSSKKEMDGSLKEKSNIFSMTVTIDDSKDIQVSECCLSDDEQPENDLNNTLDLVNTIMLEHLYQSCSPCKLADLKRSIQHSVAAAQHRHDTINLVSDDDSSFTDDDEHSDGGENYDNENKKDEYVCCDERGGVNDDGDDNKENVESNYSRNIDPYLDVLNADKGCSDYNNHTGSSHTENKNDVGVNNVQKYTSSGQKKLEHKSPDVEIPVKCPSPLKFGYSSMKVKPRSPASREKPFPKSPRQKLQHASTPRYKELQSPLQSYLRSEPTLIQVVKPKFKTPGNIKNFWCLEATPDDTSTKESSVCPKKPLGSPNTLPVVRYTSRPTVDINGPRTPIVATGPCEKVPGAITPIVTKHIGHVKIVNSGSPLKLAEPRLSIVQSSLAGRSDTLAGHNEASSKHSPSKFGHRIPILKSNLAGQADMLVGKSKKEAIIVGSKTD